MDDVLQAFRTGVNVMADLVVPREKRAQRCNALPCARAHVLDTCVTACTQRAHIATALQTRSTPWSGTQWYSM